MKSAYSSTGVYNLAVTNEARRWWKHGYIDKLQFENIGKEYVALFYHPNFAIRIVLFVATLIGLSGITGMGFLVVADVGKDGMLVSSFIYGILSFIMLELFFIRNNHYKSGITEAILYHSCGFTLASFSDSEVHIILIAGLIIFSFAAFRYLDLLCTLAAVGFMAATIFYELYNAGGILQQIIPFAFIVGFSILYVIVKRKRGTESWRLWRNNLLLIEYMSLLLIYLGGNYLVIRELSINLLNLKLAPGEDIPFAVIFYFLTGIIPVIYLYFGIVKRDIVLIRVSLLVLAASVFTIKYYYNFGHPEITLTLAGAIVLMVTYLLMNYLKAIRNGFTRENLLSEKWANANVEGFIISQTLGGNQGSSSQGFKGGDGSFGGGGSSGNF